MKKEIKHISKPRFYGKGFAYSIVCENWGETMYLKLAEDDSTLADEFLDLINKTFGTDYPFNPYKEKVAKDYESDKEKYDGFGVCLHTSYFLKYFEDDNNYALRENYVVYKPYNEYKTTTTFGYFTKDELIAFADSIIAYRNGERGDVNTEVFNEMEDKVAKAKAVKEEADKAVQTRADEAVKMVDDADIADRIRTSFNHDFSRNIDKYYDAVFSAKADAKKRLSKALAPHIKRYGAYFKCKVGENIEFLSDNATEFTGSKFIIIPRIKKDGIVTYDFKGTIIECDAKLDFDDLTEKEVHIAVDAYNDLWGKAKWTTR